MATHRAPYITSSTTDNKFSSQSSYEASTSNSFEIKARDDERGIGPGTTPKSDYFDKERFVTNGKLNEKAYNNAIKPNYKLSDTVGGLSLSTIMDKLDKSLNIANSNDTVAHSFKRMSSAYNRFKTVNQNQPLIKGFPHVFFVKPSCSILQSIGTNYASLRPEIKALESFSYVWNKCPDVIHELYTTTQEPDFMMSLSNAVAGFSLSDEYINHDTYGKTYTGYKISYGKNNIESKTAGEFSVTFNDDRDLHIYQISKLWTDYISAIYRGEISPAQSNILNKIIDYVGACYYFLTAEDNETIIFWCKYYGVFPTNAPVTQYAWGAGNTISNPQIDITFRYSFKENYNPYTFIEFNTNAKLGWKSNMSYVPTYDSKLGHVGDTWVGVPFVELEEDASKLDGYNYKLRFSEL